MSTTDSKDGDTTRLCSYCKREIASVNFGLHELHCMRHIALCPQCNEPVPKTQLKEHIAQEHSKVPCALCKKEFEKCELEDHKISNCDQRPFTCHFCEIELPMIKMQEHEDACGSRTEKCVTCQSYVMMKHAAEHKSSDCRPPEEEPDWLSEEEAPEFGYVDDAYENNDDMLPCEFCDRPFPLDFLIQHQSGCERNALHGKTFSKAHQPRQSRLPDNDISKDAYLASVAKDLNIKPNDKELKDVGVNNLTHEMQEYSPRLPNSQKRESSHVPSVQRRPVIQKQAADHVASAQRLPISQKRASDHVPNVQSDKAPVEKQTNDKSHTNFDSESAQNEASPVKDDYTSFDVIPCEFCDQPIELTHIMDHQQMCRWVHPNRAFQGHHSAVKGSNDDFDESPTRYQPCFRGQRGDAYPSRGLTNGNTKWTSERNSHVGITKKYPYTEKQRPRWEVENDRDSDSETLPTQPRSQGWSGHQSYHQDRRQPHADDQRHRYNGRWQHEEQGSARPLMDFDGDDVRQRDEQRTTRQQHEDNRWSKGQRGQPDKSFAAGKQVRNDNPRSRTPREGSDSQSSTDPQEHLGCRETREQVKVPDIDRSRALPEEPDVPRSKGQKQVEDNLRLEKQDDTREQRKRDHGYRSQPRRQQVEVRQRWTQRADDEEEVASQSERVHAEEEDWRRKRPTDGQSQAKFPRGRATRPAQNHTYTQRDEEDNGTPKEPPANTRTERGRGGQTHWNPRHIEGQEVRPREGDDQGQTRPGRRGRGRGRQNWRQSRWNRTKDQAEEDYYNAPWPRRSHRDHNE